MKHIEALEILENFFAVNLKLKKTAMKNTDKLRIAAKKILQGIGTSEGPIVVQAKRVPNKMNAKAFSIVGNWKADYFLAGTSLRTVLTVKNDYTFQSISYCQYGEVMRVKGKCRDEDGALIMSGKMVGGPFHGMPSDSARAITWNNQDQFTVSDILPITFKRIK